MTDTETANALRKVQAEVNEYQTELLKVPATELPANYDAVVLAEWTDALAGQISEAKTEAAYFEAFWETHHLLAEHMPYEKAVWIYFNHADEMLSRAIERYTA